MTPSILRKVIYAGARSSSFACASDDLKALAESNISSQRVRRWTEIIGNERATQTAQSKATYDAMNLPKRRECAAGVEPPDLACVQMDGGRIQIRERLVSNEDTDRENRPLKETISGDEAKGYWRESKVGCLLRMTSQVSNCDPSPVLPSVFTDKAGMKQMCSEIKGFSSLDLPETSSKQNVAKPLSESNEDIERPKIISRCVVASRLNSSEFGLQLAAAAHREGLNASKRKAFVCDGQAANWKVWEQWFSHYTPIVDVVHAICYVYAAAMAGKSHAAGWALYTTWAQWLWQGDVKRIIDALVNEQARLGKPTKDESTTSPRYTVSRALTYLRNQQERMDYPTYRQQGLPITSSHIESTIKQINKRVKGSEKFWDRSTEAILHLSADYVGSTTPIEQFWADRPGHLASTRVRRTIQNTLAKAA